MFAKISEKCAAWTIVAIVLLSSLLAKESFKQILDRCRSIFDEKTNISWKRSGDNYKHDTWRWLWACCVMIIISVLCDDDYEHDVTHHCCVVMIMSVMCDVWWWLWAWCVTCDDDYERDVWGFSVWRRRQVADSSASHPAAAVDTTRATT